MSMKSRIASVRTFALVLLLILIDQSTATLTFAASGNSSASRVALIIGNADYKFRPLKNPVNDATAFAAKLEGLGFDVLLKTNQSPSQMRAAVRDFSKKLEEDTVALFYFAGHGVELNGQNYLMPVGSQLDFDDVLHEEDMQDETLPLNRLLRRMQSSGSAVNLIFLDACRDNPFTFVPASDSNVVARGSSRGLARRQSPSGVFIAYATSPGSIALDGSGDNGIYTKALLRHIDTPGKDITEVMNAVRADVRRETSDAQIPWENSMLMDRFYLSGGKSNAQQVDHCLKERGAWELATALDDEAVFGKFLELYPAGCYLAKARTRFQRSLGADEGLELVSQADYHYFEKSNYQRAFALYKQAADKGSYSAKASLAKLFALGRGGARKDLDRARRLFDEVRRKTESLAVSGNAFAAYQIASLYELIEQDMDRAASFYDVAAKGGQAAAQHNLANLYRKGLGVAQNMPQALKWYETAASNGFSLSQYLLALLLIEGEQSEVQQKQAVLWLRRAAERGYARAQHKLAELHIEGSIVEQSDKEAFKWFLTAGSLGFARAQTNACIMYLNGRGVKRSVGAAKSWCERAAKQGEQKAIDVLRQIPKS